MQTRREASPSCSLSSYYTRASNPFILSSHLKAVRSFVAFDDRHGSADTLDQAIATEDTVITSVIAVPAIEPELIPLSRNGWVPNNDRLPVLLYRRAFAVDDAPNPAAIFEQAFQRNGWPAQWRNDVYAFHHYHSNAHEILGFAAGTATLVLGGEGGREITVNAGDVLVLPAGCGHRKSSGSADFLAVGAYPPGQQWDTCCSTPSDADLERVRVLAFPDSDPVSGLGGPLTRHWSVS
jgi:uncharacterized protein YjlB